MIFSSPRLALGAGPRWLHRLCRRGMSFFTRQKSSGSPASGSPGRVRPWERADASTVLICRRMSIRRLRLGVAGAVDQFGAQVGARRTTSGLQTTR
jgi:hypothetical protein